MPNDLTPRQNDAEAESLEGKTPSPSEIEDVRQAYLKTIEMPAEKQGPQILVCPVGLVGSGKTTVMKPLSQRLGLVRVSTDDIRTLLKARGFNYARTLEIARGIVEPLLKDGYRIGLDMDCTGSAKPYIENIAKEMMIRVVWLHINPPESYILNKFHHLEYKPGLIFANEADAIANYERRKPLHQDLDIPFAYVFDPSRDDLAAQINEATNLIERI